MGAAGFEPQRARRASDGAGSNPGRPGWARLVSNHSEPGGRAMALVRTQAALDGPGWFRTSDLSRVKRRAWRVGETPETAIPSGTRHYEQSRLCLADCRGLRTIS